MLLQKLPNKISLQSRSSRVLIAYCISMVGPHWKKASFQSSNTTDRHGEIKPRTQISNIAKIILTNFVVRIKGWMIAYCIVNTKNSYSLKLAFQNFAPNHTLFRVSVQTRVRIQELNTNIKINQ
jgi:hypothetical protein